MNSSSCPVFQLAGDLAQSVAQGADLAADRQAAVLPQNGARAEKVDALSNSNELEQFAEAIHEFQQFIAWRATASRKAV